MTAELLNEAQKISLTVTLRLIEERLTSLQMDIHHRKGDGELVRFQSDLAEKQLSELGEQIENIFKLIQQIKIKFDLPIKQVRLSDILRAMAAHFETMLIDVTSAKLKRYGAVSPELEQNLDPLIDSLITHINKLDSKTEMDDRNGKNN